jgi:alpha-acetolactate decarboxylase
MDQDCIDHDIITPLYLDRPPVDEIVFIKGYLLHIIDSCRANDATLEDIADNLEQMIGACKTFQVPIPAYWDEESLP